ncbi:hypothetical protein CPCC7001_2078 [Cyanobium sp. PCC 7001]|uniref:hypothetical protein n=1 Tax=Cyanobium sp. PCC 7001 TaxID=180281 RepID=UPI00018049A8|nr:hypothetical protein [Cyanobium sp. PCC 7001]EDY39198.1 hypothetical protein CPCC7001_2078 [Cyanobium sp. PCC 7001]
MFPPDGDHFLKIRVSVRMLKCNFSCQYCVAAAGQSQVSGVDYSTGAKRNVWGTDVGREMARKSITWAASLPFKVGLRYDVHGEPFLNADVIEDLVWLTQQSNIHFVEVQTNASLLRKQLPSLVHRLVPEKLKLFCTFHHTEISLDDFLENVLFASGLGFGVVVNTLLSADNVDLIHDALDRCSQAAIPTSADLKFPGFDVPATQEMSARVDVDKRARHFLSCDPIDAVLEGDAGPAILRTVADSGPLGRELRFLAALLVGLYGGTGRLCSAGHDYLIVDNWGDVYPCTSYADIQKGRLGSVLDPGFVPPLRQETYAPCQYAETCHQKEEYGNLQILREHRDLLITSLNCLCAGQGDMDAQSLFNSRMALIEMARHNLQTGTIGRPAPTPAASMR